MHGSHEITEKSGSPSAGSNFSRRRGLQQCHFVTVPGFALTLGFTSAWKQPQSLFQFNILAGPPTSQGRQVVTAGHSQRQERILAGEMNSPVSELCSNKNTR